MLHDFGKEENSNRARACRARAFFCPMVAGGGDESGTPRFAPIDGDAPRQIQVERGVPQRAGGGSAQAAGGESSHVGTIGTDVQQLFDSFRNGDADAGRKLYRTLRECDFAVAGGAMELSQWRQRTSSETDPVLKSRLSTQLRRAERATAECAAISPVHLDMLDELLEEAARRGDPIAVVVMMQRGFRGDPSGPFAAIERQLQKKKIVDLAMRIVEGGDPSVLSELSVMLASDEFGHSDVLEAYESLFAYALHRGDAQEFQGVIDRRLVELRRQLSDADASAAENSARVLIERCCQK